MSWRVVLECIRERIWGLGICIERSVYSSVDVHRWKSYRFLIIGASSCPAPMLCHGPEPGCEVHLLSIKHNTLGTKSLSYVFIFKYLPDHPNSTVPGMATSKMLRSSLHDESSPGADNATKEREGSPGNLLMHFYPHPTLVERL